VCVCVISCVGVWIVLCAFKDIASNQLLLSLFASRCVVLPYR
jgi:hypothetical protein